MGHGHHHQGAGDMSTRRLTIAVAINVLLTIAQVIGGVVSGSLALVADALHNLSDAASLGIALFARRVAGRRADERRTFGYARAEVIGALVNLTTLIIVGLYLVVEAVGRFFGDHEPGGWIIVIVAGIALVIDIATALLTLSVAKGNMNIKAAFIHNLSDAAASVGVIIAGTLIILYQWYWVDLAVTLLISGYVLWQGFTMLPGAIRILMESAPEGFDLDELVTAMRAVEGVAEVHHLHVWQIGEHDTALEAHVVVEERDPDRGEAVKRSLRACLEQRFHIGHATLELEFGGRATHCGDGERVPGH